MRVAARDDVMVTEDGRRKSSDGAAAQVAAQAAEITQLRAQVQQLTKQARHERVVSQGLLDAQPGLAAAARREQSSAPAERAGAGETEKVVRANDELAARARELAVQVQHQPATAVAQTLTDSRITGISRNSVGVERGVHARQQAQLAMYRKERDAK